MLTNEQIKIMDITRVVYERGVSIRLNDQGFWQFESQQINLPLIRTDNDSVQRDYGLKPIMVAIVLPSKHTFTSIVTNRLGHKLLLDIENSDISQNLSSLYPTVKLYDGFNQTYVLGAVSYHLKQMAEQYCRVNAELARFPGGAVENNDIIYGNQPEPYYEFDAWLSSALRCYDTCRYLLWDTFRGTGSIPSSFAKVVEVAKGIPEDLKQRLKHSWHSYGATIKEYRDCIHHYSPLDFGMSSARATALSGIIWSTRMLIPDNPEARSKVRFRFDNKIDALSYAWDSTIEVVTLVNEIVGAISSAKENDG